MTLHLPLFATLVPLFADDEMGPGVFALIMIPLALFFFAAAIFNWQWIYFDRRYRRIRDALGEGGARAMLAFAGLMCVFGALVGAARSGVFTSSGDDEPYRSENVENHPADFSMSGRRGGSGSSNKPSGKDTQPEDQGTPPTTAADLGTPGEPLPELVFDSPKLKWLSGIDNPADDADFKALAPKGGLLVGLIITESKWGSTPIIGSLQPVFQVEDEYVVGDQFGEAQGKAKRLLARPGYAVASVNAREALLIDGLQLVFQRVGDGHLMPSQVQQSAWAGNTTGGTACSIEPPPGGLVVGIRGKIGSGGEVKTFDLACIEGKPLPATSNLDETTNHTASTSPDRPTTDDPGGRLGRLYVDRSGNDDRDESSDAAVSSTAAEDTSTTEPEDATPRADIAGLSKPIGNDRGTPYKDMAPEGARMAGLQVTYALWAGRDRYIGSIQPLYQRPSGEYVKGGVYGDEREEKGNAVAKPGYAVGAIAVRPGLKINAVQVVFMKVNNGRLDPRDAYESEWFGTETGGEELLDGGGRPIIGIQGGHEKDLNGLQLVFGK